MTELVVVSVSWDGVTVAANDETARVVSWVALRAAAMQDDARLRGVYAGLLDEARRAARRHRQVKVRVSNLSGWWGDSGARTWAAQAVTMAGETLRVAADWGLSGTKGYAERDAEEAREVLPRRGYRVV